MQRSLLLSDDNSLSSTPQVNRSNSAPCCSLKQILIQWKDSTQITRGSDQGHSPCDESCVDTLHAVCVQSPEYDMMYSHRTFRNVRNPRPMLRGWHPGYHPPQQIFNERCENIASYFQTRSTILYNQCLERKGMLLIQNLHEAQHRLFEEQRREIFIMETSSRQTIYEHTKEAFQELYRFFKNEIEKLSLAFGSEKGSEATDLREQVDFFRVQIQRTWQNLLCKRKKTLEFLSVKENSIREGLVAARKDEEELAALRNVVRNREIYLESVRLKNRYSDADKLETELNLHQRQIERLQDELSEARIRLYDVYSCEKEKLNFSEHLFNSDLSVTPQDFSDRFDTEADILEAPPSNRDEISTIKTLEEIQICRRYQDIVQWVITNNQDCEGILRKEIANLEIIEKCLFINFKPLDCHEH